MPFRKIDAALMQPGKTPKRVVASAWGLDKDGKTTFGLGFPQPIYLFNTNYGWEGLPKAKEVAEAGGLHVSDYAMPDEYKLENYERIIKQFEEEWNDILPTADREHGTVMLDKADEIWGLVSPTLREKAERKRYERHLASGKDDKTFKPMQTDYQDPNLWARSKLVQPLQYEHVNAIYISGAREIWKSDGSGGTGHFTFHGFKETPGLTQAHFRVFTETTPIFNSNQVPTGKFRTETKVEIQLCRFDRALQGWVFTPPTFEQFLKELED
jgi:hypothetical protein